MEQEQIQNLIAAIESLIVLIGENNKTTEARIVQQMQTDKLSNVQSEAVLALLSEIKQENKGEKEGRKMFHEEQLGALGKLVDSLKEQLSSQNGSVAGAVDKLASELNLANKDLQKCVCDLKECFEPQESVKITNFADLQFPPVQKVEVINKPEKPEEVIIIEPKWFKAFDYTRFFESLRAIFSSLTLKVKSEEILRVNVLDDKGKIVNDFAPHVSAGGAGDSVYLKNKNGQAINPATEESLQQVYGIFKNYAKKITTVGTTTYIAIAPVGSAQNKAVWQAKKIAVSGGDTVITWASGNDNFDKTATNLPSLSYS